MFKTDNSLHVFVGPLETSSIAEAAVGDMFIVDENSAIISDGAIGTDHTHFKVGCKYADGSVRYSPLIKYANITRKTSLLDVARSEQSTFLGGNGSTGSIDDLNSNRYTLRVNFKNDNELYSEQSDQHFFEYVSDASATEIEVANYFAQNMSKNAKFSGKRLGKNRASVKVERFTSAADAIISTDITSVEFINGSKVGKVIFGSGSDLSGVVVGNYLRIGEDGNTTAVPVATTDAIYKVVDTYDSGAATGSTITLDQPFQGTSAVYTDPAVNQITAAVMATANVGLRVMALEQEWILGLKPALANTAAVIGSGHPRQIAELEWFGLGSSGAPYRHGVANNADLIAMHEDGTATGATAGNRYNVIELQVDLDDPGHAVSGSGKGKMTVVLAGKSGASLSAVTTFFDSLTPAWD